MTSVLLSVGVVVAVAAAARSTYSPCGLSMLSTITPFGERARRHRYWVTGAWFVVGAAAGGATLGAGAAGLAGVVAASGLGGRPGAAAVVGAVAAAGAAAVDAGWLGDVLPVIRRQVDDGWLGRYRPWVYGAGFGWQVGVGLATYVMTAAVGLLLVLAALTGRPLDALVTGVVFGTARGLTVFLTASCSTPARLRDLHSRLDRAGSAVRWGVVAVQGAAAVVLALSAAGAIRSGPGWLAAGLAAVCAAVAVAVLVGLVGLVGRPARARGRRA